jgi:nicotinamidase/pyrazinamidase
MKSIKLLIVDPQCDFCDPKGVLYVKGAWDDSLRLGDFINKFADKISNIYVTLDSHNPVHIAHPVFWIDNEGNHPTPFTQIKSIDITNNKWMATKPEWRLPAKEYLGELDKIGVTHTIWPPHCIIGTWGHGIVEPVCRSVVNWANKTINVVNYVAKGSNSFTEQFSAYRAAVIVPNDPTTHPNKVLANSLNYGDEDILVAGEALDYCVANTLTDLFTEIKPERFILLNDATSSVGLDKNLGTEFLDKAKKLGMRISNTIEYTM